MEETQTEQKSLEDDTTFSSRIKLFIFHQIRLIKAQEIWFDSLKLIILVNIIYIRQQTLYSYGRITFGKQSIPSFQILLDQSLSKI